MRIRCPAVLSAQSVSTEWVSMMPNRTVHWAWKSNCISRQKARMLLLISSHQVHRAPRPTRPDKARRLGYKAKQVWNCDNLLELERIWWVNDDDDSLIALRIDFLRDTSSTASPWGGVDASALLPRVAPMVSLELRFCDQDCWYFRH